MRFIFQQFSLQQFLLGLLALSSACCTTQASIYTRNQRSHYAPSKRFGGSVIEEGLPLWLERRAVEAESDELWDPVEDGENVYSDQALEDLQVQEAMSLRSREEMEKLREILSADEIKKEKHRVNIRNQPVRVVRRDAPTPTGVGQISGLRSHMSWQPLAIGLVCSVFGIMAIVGAVTYYQKVQLPRKRAQERPGKPSPPGSLLGDTTSVSLDGDRKLAHSAQMYHYQHQKQQMLAVERASDAAQVSEEGSESDVEEGDFTVYECPGLSTTGQLEVENPLYEGDTATNGPSTNGSYGEIIGASDLEDTSDSTPTTKAEEH